MIVRGCSPFPWRPSFSTLEKPTVGFWTLELDVRGVWAFGSRAPYPFVMRQGDTAQCTTPYTGQVVFLPLPFSPLGRSLLLLFAHSLFIFFRLLRIHFASLSFSLTLPVVTSLVQPLFPYLLFSFFSFRPPHRCERSSRHSSRVSILP